MKKVFLVKKNPELPNAEDNWIVMNTYEFAMFMHTDEGKRRRACFARLDACDMDDVIYYAECGETNARQWRAETDHSDYLREKWDEQEYSVYSFYGIPGTDGNCNGESLIADESCDVESNALENVEHEKLYQALSYLHPDDRELIEDMYLRGRKKTVEEMCSKYAMTRASFLWLRGLIFQRLCDLIEDDLI